MFKFYKYVFVNSKCGIVVDENGKFDDEVFVILLEQNCKYYVDCYGYIVKRLVSEGWYVEYVVFILCFQVN